MARNTNARSIYTDQAGVCRTHTKLNATQRSPALSLSPSLPLAGRCSDNRVFAPHIHLCIARSPLVAPKILFLAIEKIQPVFATPKSPSVCCTQPVCASMNQRHGGISGFWVLGQPETRLASNSGAKICKAGEAHPSCRIAF